MRDTVRRAQGLTDRKPMYRSSKLTQLLRHSFESRCALGMILHVKADSQQPSLHSAEFARIMMALPPAHWMDHGPKTMSASTVQNAVATLLQQQHTRVRNALPAADSFVLSVNCNSQC